MRSILCAALLCAAPVFAGDLVMKNKANGSELRLLDASCTHGETLGHLNEVWRPKFKNARILSAKGHIEFYGCWIQHDAETAYVILQDGAEMMFPLAGFADPSI